jgi:hypothetical protein
MPRRLNTREFAMISKFRQTGWCKFSTAHRRARSKVMRDIQLLATATASLLLLSTGLASADPPNMTVGYQPMVSTGLAAKHPFEAWFVFDKSADPRVPGYAVPSGTKVRLTFPKEFTPLTDHPHLEGALLYGWPHGAVPVPFRVTQNDMDPRVVEVRIDQAISIGSPEGPGLKAIHVRTGELNPILPGDYAISVQFIDAGPLSGTTMAVAHITERPLPNVAAYNQLHQAKDEDWQRVKVGSEAALPIDFLVTLPDKARSSFALAPVAGGGLSILCDGMPIGSITVKGVPVTLTPQNFGPGFSRLGIVELRAKANMVPGTAEIVAVIEGGPQYVINLVVEGP